MNYADQPAFPLTVGKHDTAGDLYYETFGGLTKREYIATKILAGLAANSQAWQEWDWDKTVEMSITLTDHLIAELNYSNKQ